MLRIAERDSGSLGYTLRKDLPLFWVDASWGQGNRRIQTRRSDPVSGIRHVTGPQGLSPDQLSIPSICRGLCLAKKISHISL